MTQSPESSISFSSRELFAFCGKYAGGCGSYHPLLCHMIDVAEVTGALWKSCLGTGMRTSISSSLGCSDEAAHRTIMFWAALHDLGKASPAFQRRCASAVPRLESQGLSFRRQFGDDKGGWHGLITALKLAPLLEERGCPHNLAHDLARGLGGHHGSWPTALESLNSDHYGDKGWDSARKMLVDILASLYAPVVMTDTLFQRNQRQALVTLLSGLVSVADWIGSIKDPFTPKPEAVNASWYEKVARKRAAEVLKVLKWDKWIAPVQPAPFSMLFPKTPDPNAMQRTVIELAEHLQEPSLVVIEAPTGCGKTEAALTLADHLASRYGQRGLYVAMPTTATSNAMYDRLREMLDARYGMNTVTPLLIHSQALWREPPPIIETEHEANDDTSIEAMSWFLPRKRGLLAPFAVGTVDQALLSVLLTRHFFVRLFGLAHKTVVFDEVHAYDTYMSTLFTRLLAWLRAEGASVILLSATLPERTRREFLQAWDATAESAPVTAYPAITWACGNNSGCLLPEPDPALKRTIYLEQLSPEQGAIIDALRDRLAAGGCAAVLCNTVGRAQEIYRLLREANIVPEQDLILFHARYPMAWRREIEERVLARFGKSSTPEQRRGIVVATQVIEQSLDLDFDLMVSDLAPIDLLLQRAGRLHRHQKRTRPPRLEEPRMLLVKPQELAGLPVWGSDSYVYEPYILLRTWLTVRDCSKWELPSETRELIEAVYGNQEPEVGEELAAVLRVYREDWEQSLREDALKARKSLILPVSDEDLLLQSNPFLAEDNTDAHHDMRARTRLGEPGLSLVCLHQTSEGVCTNPEGGMSIAFDHTPTHIETGYLANCIVSVNHRGLITTLLEKPAPSAWKKNSLLRHTRMLVFKDGDCTIKGVGGDYILHLTREFGLEIEKQSSDI